MDDSLLQIAKDYGPAALSLVGTGLGAAFGVVGFVVRYAWKQHTARITNLVKVTADLAKSIRDHEKTTEERFKLHEHTIQALRAEMHMAQQKWDHIRVSLLGCEANIKSQQNTITEHIRELAKVDSKFDAIFRFIDAPQRRTDKA